MHSKESKSYFGCWLLNCIIHFTFSSVKYILTSQNLLISFTKWPLAINLFENWIKLHNIFITLCIYIKYHLFYTVRKRMTNQKLNPQMRAQKHQHYQVYPIVLYLQLQHCWAESKQQMMIHFQLLLPPIQLLSQIHLVLELMFALQKLLKTNQRFTHPWGLFSNSYASLNCNWIALKFCIYHLHAEIIFIFWFRELSGSIQVGLDSKSSTLTKNKNSSKPSADEYLPYQSILSKYSSKYANHSMEGCVLYI